MSATTPAKSSTETPSFDWGVPGIPLAAPPSRNPLPAMPPPLGDLQFTPSGAYNLRRHLGAKMESFNCQRHRFIPSDISWLASGASEDRRHLGSPGVFFPEFFHLYESLPTGGVGQVARREWGDRIWRLLWDLATKYDCATAGTTFIVHVGGTTIPGAPLDPERLRAEVYLPPHFLADHPEVHSTVVFLVQTVIEQIGIPTAADWRSKVLRVWSLTQRGYLPAVTLPRTLIPAPNNTNSSQYVFRGRPWGQLAPPGPPTHSPAAQGLVPVNEGDIAVFDIDEIMHEEELIQAVARAERAEAENTQLHETIDSLQLLTATMQSEFDDRERVTQAELDHMTAQILRLERELSAARRSFDSSPPPSPTVCSHVANVSAPRLPGAVLAWSSISSQHTDQIARTYISAPNCIRVENHNGRKTSIQHP
ncbi:hypothetical protein DFH09DRAFT_1093638 [Mycena vulgaris]|nr:hypothetical protein DFH09DRAFT_1093638 [Mycena vulgaris]